MAVKKIATRKTNDFISFILDAEKSADLATKFIKIDDAERLYQFFYDLGYKGIPRDACEDILKAKNKWDDLTDCGHGKPPCDGPRKGY